MPPNAGRCHDAQRRPAAISAAAPSPNTRYRVVRFICFLSRHASGPCARPAGPSAARRHCRSPPATAPRPARPATRNSTLSRTPYTDSVTACRSGSDGEHDDRAADRDQAEHDQHEDGHSGDSASITPLPLRVEPAGGRTQHRAGAGEQDQDHQHAGAGETGAVGDDGADADQRPATDVRRSGSAAAGTPSGTRSAASRRQHGEHRAGAEQHVRDDLTSCGRPTAG